MNKKSGLGIMSPFDVEKFDSHKRYLLLHHIKEMKKKIEFIGENLLKGIRYSNDDEIVRRVLQYIYVDQNEIYEASNNLFLKITVHDIDPIIKMSLQDAGHSDYNYEYDKEY